MCDVVVTWVDGSDERWLAERRKYHSSDASSGASFYRDWGLLRFWFRGIEKNLSWINRVYFITCGHVPPWLDTGHPKLRVVRHDEFIPKEYLPTFSSAPIEWNINRLDGLSEEFVSFNDDMFLLDAVDKSFFFRDGLPVDCFEALPITDRCTSIFGHLLWNCVAAVNRHFSYAECAERNRDKWFSPLYPEEVLKRNEAALLWKSFPGFGFDHFPIPLLKSELDDVWAKNRKLLTETCKHKFRSSKDAIIWLVRYWQLAKGRFVPEYKDDRRYVSVDEPNSVLRDAILDTHNKVVCLNDSEAPLDFERKARYIQRLMELRLPEMSSFEKT